MLAPMPDETSDASEGTRRSRVLEAVSRTLAEQKRAAVELQAVVEQSGISLADVQAEFPDLDDLLVALAAHQAEALCGLLWRRANNGEQRNVKATLMELGLALEQAYSSELIGFCRVAMTEGSRPRAVRQRVYDNGPGAVAAALTDFLEHAKAAGALAVDDCALAAEHLVGLFREPLYWELTLHSREFALSDNGSNYVSSAVQLFLNGCGNKDVAKQ